MGGGGAWNWAGLGRGSGCGCKVSAKSLSFFGGVLARKRRGCDFEELGGMSAIMVPMPM